MSHSKSSWFRRMFSIIAMCLIMIAAAACIPVASIPTPAVSPTVPTASRTSPTPEPARSPGNDGFVAILTFTEGDVRIEQATAGRTAGLTRLQTGNGARPWQQLSSKSTVRTSAGGRATVVCFNNRYFTIQPNGSARVGQRCQVATPLPGGAANRVKPDAGRLRAYGGSLVLEEEAREKEGDYGRIPIILAPRNTALPTREPMLRWVAVSDALEYEPKLSGPKPFAPIRVDAQKLACQDDALAAPYRACSLPWPADRWTLQPGQSYFLTIGARLSAATPLRQSEDSELHTLGQDEASQVQAAAAEIDALALDPITRDVLLGGLYAGRGIYGDASATYRQALAAQPAPLLYVTLGDVYRASQLYRGAFGAYQQALEGLSAENDPAVRAAAEFGLGQVYLAYADNYAEAEKHYTAAARLYESLDAAEALQASQKGVAEARARQR